MKHFRLLIVPALIVAISVCIPNAISVAYAYKNINTKIAPATPVPMVTACSQPTGQSDLDVNNVRTRILTAGDFWWDYTTQVAAYEIPKGSGLFSIYAGSLWIGGYDGANLKVAAQTYGHQGSKNDFWPGPLDTTGKASVFSETVCYDYDQIWKITRKEVEDFVAGVPATPVILNWPGNGDKSKGQAQYLAPFYDKDADGIYNPSAGDYPGYDLVAGDGYGDCQETNCIPNDQLYGDQTLFWIFNDKGNGNTHDQSKGEPIGLEIRAQAFGFFTDDEVNNMTFYNYRIFNRSTYKLDTCYFAVWCDADLGLEYKDDYVGCDVQRGLGYTYNADDLDVGGYESKPPAVGIDFFRGPIADKNDARDNDRDSDSLGVCDNDNKGKYGVDEPCEQSIMSKFVYFTNNAPSGMGDPNTAVGYYNYLSGKWDDGMPFTYGGTGKGGTTKCDFMFPGNTDKHDWGTGGNCSTTPTLPFWDEFTSGALPDDRRMVQSAGPFTLMPGAVNVITTGVVWAQASAGGAKASVKLLQVVDDKAQALFDNCFKVLDGPTAPDLTIQELDKELILYLTNTDPNSNNFNENYSEFDPLISLIDSAGNSCPNLNKNYTFEGYKIYQLKNATVSASELDNLDNARLIFQCDLKNGINRLINYEFDQTLGAGVPKEKVNGADQGLSHSIKITTDAFATGSPILINHKTYYFMAVAYGYNEFKKYQQDVPPNSANMCDAAAGALTGQKKSYKQGRKNLVNYSAIPHISTPYTGGTEMHAEYGSGPMITRIEGNGNGGMELELTASTVSAILSAADHRTKTPTYDYGKGPINVRVVDPLNVPDGQTFTLKFDSTNIGNSTWKLTNNTTLETIKSDKTIMAVNEQLLLKWGLSISIVQITDPGNAASVNNGYITSSMSFADPSKNWLTGLADKDGPYYSNWIRSGTITGSTGFQNDHVGIDVDQIYEGVVGGTWAPYRLCGATELSAAFDHTKYYTGPGFKLNLMSQAQMKDLASVDVVITSDISKWSRAVVLELCEDSGFSANTAGIAKKARKLDYRRAASVDKNGSTATGSDNNDFSTGMGWFPGYAINLETGERLNIAFGENSALVNENGNDMKWNPTANQTAQTYNLPWDTVGQPFGSPVYGGQHYIYVFGHNKDNDGTGTANTPNDFLNVPRYDKCKRIREILDTLSSVPADAQKREIFREAMWVNIPLLASSHSLLESDATVKLRVAKPYRYGYSSAFWTDGTPPPVHNVYPDTAATTGGQNGNLPMYTFSTNGIATHTGENELAIEALDFIRVVPNPYYAYSNYETSSLDNRVKITNLPEICTVSIYNLSGTLIRKYKKGEAKVNLTPKEATSSATWHDGSIDWDLKNSVNIPISSGVYIIHVEVPGVGEKVVKWFGVMRPIDLDSF
ncbi:MAG: T9SS C-terminal target domain-containing protein [Bacteroidetes bacterium]|nr:MAG: T9SS C-terminal target domain-containing protein [Bacteroidota bacterium]